MTLPLTQTWGGAGPNQTPTQPDLLSQDRSLQSAIRTAAIAAGWSVYYECGSTDGTSGGLVAGSAGDTTARCAADIAWVWGATNCSWSVLRSPANYPTTGQRLYLTIACDSASTYNSTYTIATAAPTGGSTSARPTQPTSKFVAFTTQVTPTTLTTQHYWTCGIASGGDFFLHAGTLSSGIYSFSIECISTANAVSSCVFPVMFCASYNSAGGQQINNMNAPAAFDNFGNAVSAARLCLPAHPVAGSYLAACTGANPLDSSNRWPGLPVLVAAVGSGGAIWGTLRDVYGAPFSSVAVGTEEPTGGTTEMATCGSFWWPNLGVTPAS